MKVEHLRSPHDLVGGLVYFGRMLDKIRLHAQGKLPADYVENLGTAFDGRCCSFLKIDYAALVARVKQGDKDKDEAILDWAFKNGRKPSDEEIEIWNEFMRKRGWNDAASPRLKSRKAELRASDRDDIQTFFDFIDLDEERPLRAPAV
ncbi:MAG: DUF5069 domain-containing protein [Verrucomicrobiae bacterium]|nr:DUF5069 domain-containing protein [Verrucomicrobiae bacterium]